MTSHKSAPRPAMPRPRGVADIKFLKEEQLRPEIGIAVGTRPGIVMMAPVIHQLRRRAMPHFVIHTGQHYSPNMDAQFFADLDLPPADYRLDGVAQKHTHGGQTAAMLEGVEAVLLERRPCLFLVCGDANTNLAGAIAARKLHIGVGHIEAGERSYDWRMPEEHNRVMIDHISDYLFTTSERGARTLRAEGIRGRIYAVGNPIVDAARHHAALSRRRQADVLRRFALDAGSYAIMTAHREENVDDYDQLRGALEGTSQAGAALGLPVLLLAHPRTRKRLEEFGLLAWAATLPALIVADAVGYLDFLTLLTGAGLVFTDSGGVQQEACIHHIPCITLRDNTEWTETLEIGANRLAGCDPVRICAAAREALASARDWPVPFGDGAAARQIVDICGEVVDAAVARARTGSA